jgi:hypothetical protein
MENGIFRLFAANGQQKQETSVCLLQTETVNGRLFSLVSKRYTVINDCCFSKRAHLCQKACQLVKEAYQ